MLLMERYQDDELGPWLALFCAPQLSLQRAHKLLQVFQTPTVILAASYQQLKGSGVRPQALKAIADYREHQPGNLIHERVSKALAWHAAANDHHIIYIGHANYPEALAEIAQPPLLLFVAGNAALLNKPQLAMVGSRSPSFDGRQLATQFAMEISRNGLLITSGLAIGIDGASHAGALAAGFPTIAVMATGIDQVYPKQHRELAQKVREHGALVTEFPLGQAPKAQNFPQRNRIISGLSLGVLVVEAAVKSGSLITARFALEQNREVFAIPGSIHNPVARGCHRLIRDGAKLVESAQDISDELSLQLSFPLINDAGSANEEVTSLDRIQQLVLEKMGFDTVSMDALVERTELVITELSAVLTQLLLLGQVENTECGFVRIFIAQKK